jgi:hypothetical protein
VVNFADTGSWSATERFLLAIQRGQLFRSLEAFAQRGVDALAAATPTGTGLTAASWGYRIETSAFSAKIEWTNTHINKGVPIAVILQYGHGTGTGGYVVGRDYINPAIAPIMDELVNSVWREVTSS